MTGIETPSVIDRKPAKNLLLRRPFLSLAIAVIAMVLVAGATVTVPQANAASGVDIVILGGENAVSAAVEAELKTCTVGSVTRQSGNDRYQTAAAISRATFDSATRAFIATGLDFPDGLAGGSPAALKDQPLLLVNDSVPASTAIELRRLGVSSVIVLGGSAVVPDSVLATLSAYGPTTRIAGSDRYSTAAAIASVEFASADVVYIATGLKFPDALAGAPAAAGDAAPILLVRSDSIPGSTRAQLQRLQPSTIKILGGEATISKGVAADLALYASNVMRLSGTDRYSTAAAISKHAFPTGASKIYITAGLGSADALAGGPAAGFKNSPILLVLGDSIPDSTRAEIQRITDKLCESTTTTTVPPVPVPDLAGFPDASSTGPVDESKIPLVATGSVVSSFDGQVLENFHAENVIIQNNNVTVRNFRVTRANPDAWFAIVILPDPVTGESSRGTVFEDGEITSRNASGNFQPSAAAGITGGDFIARRLEISYMEDGIAGSKFVAEGNYIHDLIPYEGSHNDGIQVLRGENITIRRNTILLPNQQTSAVNLATYSGTIDNVLIEDNYLNGGAYTVYSRDNGYGAPTNVTVRNNAFGRDYLFGTFSYDGNPTSVNNTWADTGELIGL